MAIAGGIIGVGNIFIKGGMGTALIQKKTINDKYINAALQTSLLFGVVLFGVFLLLAPVISSFYGDYRLNSIISVISVNFILLAISNISINLLHKNFKFKNTALITIVSLLLGYITGIYLALKDFGVWSLIVATLLSSFINTIGSFMYAPIKISYKFHYKEAKELFGFGSGMMLLSISNYFSNKGLNLILGKIFTPGLLGVFERTSFLKTLPSQFLGNIMDRVLFPVMAEIQDQENKLITIFTFAMGLSNSLMIPMTVFLIFYSPEIVGILMGEKWSDAVLPLQIMFVVLPLSNAGRMADSIIRAKGLVYKNVTRKYIFTALIITLSSTLGYFYGIVGAAIGISASYFVNYIMMIVLVRNVFNKSFKEIFAIPLLTGLKLGLFIAASIISYKTAFQLWTTSNIPQFISFTIILCLTTLLIAKFKPQLFGNYISTTLSKILNK